MNSAIRIAQVMGKMMGGGVESVVLNYYRHIDRNQIQFDFIVDDDSTIIPEEEIKKLGGKVLRVSPYQNIFGYQRDLYNILKANKYQIVHSHINTLSVFSLFAAFRAGIPVRIAHSHSTAARGEFKKNILKYILRPLAKLFATHYCACSIYAAKWLFGEKTTESGKVKIMPNAIDLSNFEFNKQIRNSCRKQLGVEGRFVIGHVGRFMFQKNHEFLIDIFNEVIKNDKTAVLVLVGEGELKQKIQNRTESLGLSDSVKFLGFRKDVAEIMQAMDVFVLPSFYEGLPVVGIEAQASGLPCVMSDKITAEAKVSEIAEFVSLNEGAVVWAKAISSYKDYRESHNCLINSSKYDISQAAIELKDYYLLLKE